MRRYVLGLIFSESGRHVVLQLKTHPEWQAGQLNGIGGHVESGESFLDAMIREASEETTLYAEYPTARWDHFATVEDPGVFSMQCYRTFVRDIRFVEHRSGEEELRYVDVWEIPQRLVIGNLRWLIPFALDRHVRAPNLFNERTRAAALTGTPEADHAA